MEMMTRPASFAGQINQEKHNYNATEKVIAEFVDEITTLEEGAFESLIVKASRGEKLPVSRTDKLEKYRLEVERRDQLQLALVRSQLDGRPMAGKPAVNFLM